MAWSTPTLTTGGQLITTSFWNAQIPNNLLVLATNINTSTGAIAGNLQKFNEDISTVAFSATPTFDLSVANNFTITLTGAITSITVANWTASKSQPVAIRFLQDATGGRTIAFPAGWKWQNGSVPSVTTTANKATVVILWSPDGGTTIYAALYTDAA